MACAILRLRRALNANIIAMKTAKQASKIATLAPGLNQLSQLMWKASWTQDSGHGRERTDPESPLKQAIATEDKDKVKRSVAARYVSWSNTEWT